jgi:isopentenyl-diphosphate Delta-isomerase
MNRKDDHIHLALKQQQQSNDFDKVRFKHHAFPELNINEVDLSVTLFAKKFPTPIYINAMTGGSEQAKTLNERFAKLAKHFHLPLATGSVSIALKHPELASTFTVIREVYPEGFVFANVGTGQTVENAKKAVQLLQANALQIHVNAVQEAIMPEGDKHYRGWLKGIKEIHNSLTIPIVVKEVGFGFSKSALELIKSTGVEWVDLAGRGGTNFATIENERRTTQLLSFDDWGLSTVESLLEAKHVSGLQYLASGGIRQPLDVIKALALGANAVGLSGYFLHLVTKHSHDEAIEILEKFILELKTIMLVLGKPTIETLRQSDLIFNQELITYQTQIK